MRKEELQEAIEQGIYSGFWKPIFSTIIGFAIVLFVGMTILYFVGGTSILDGLDNSKPSVVAEPVHCQYPRVWCKVIVGNGTDLWTFHRFDACGYQEARTKYEMLKPKINESLKAYPGWRLKWLECK